MRFGKAAEKGDPRAKYYLKQMTDYSRALRRCLTYIKVH